MPNTIEEQVVDPNVALAEAANSVAQSLEDNSTAAMEEQSVKILTGLVDQACYLTTSMSTRQMGRVLRSVLRVPMEEPHKFQSEPEKRLYDMCLMIIDSKILLASKYMNDIERKSKSSAQIEAEVASEASDGSSEE